MASIMQELAQAGQNTGTHECVDTFAPAMCLSNKAALALVDTKTPIRVHQGVNGWSAGFWVKEDQNAPAGQFVLLATGCRTEKLARITASYYQLHQAINQINA